MTLLNRRSRFVLVSLAVIFLISCQSGPKVAPEKPIAIAPRERVEAHGKKWIISTQGKLATQAAAKILKEGGNLVDAAIAASFAISVERPHGTGLGGGGFLIYYEAKTKQSHVIDFRERAPIRSAKDMFVDKKGEVINGKSETGGPAVGVPGLVRGLAYIHKKWGKTKWSHLLDSAIEAAENGFQIYPDLAIALREEAPDLAQFFAAKKIFLKKNGAPKLLGETLVQDDLGDTLRTVASNPESFYRGRIATQIVATVRKYQGVMTEADMANYEVKEREPVIANYKDYQIISMSPPSSGGIHVIQILKLLEKDDLFTSGFMEPQTIHLMAQAMQQAFADRAKYLGDPDFVKVPVKQLIDDQYLQGLRAKFTTDDARKAADVVPGSIPEVAAEPSHTTHMSLMDEEGNVVVTTQSINGHFGSKVVAERTGVVLNNTMDDFSAKPGVQNMYGAVGSAANEVAPKKTPLSSMSPTIVLKDGKPILALGAKGGTRIITSVAQTILNFLVFQKDLYTSIASPRIHEQWMPDELKIENQSLVNSSLINSMERRGYNVSRMQSLSNVMAVARDESGLVGVADPRDIGTSAGE